MSLNNDNSIYGLNIYEDKKGRIIYKDFLMKNAVYIPTFDFKMFSFYRYRYIIGVSSFIVLQTPFTLFHASVLLSNILTIFIFVFLEYKFRVFLKEKQKVKKFNKSEYIGYIDVLNKQDPTKMLLKAVLYIALGILILYNGYDKSYVGVSLAFCWLIMIVCVFYGLIQFYAFSKRKS